MAHHLGRQPAQRDSLVLQRLSGGWQFVALALILGHFALPFALLLSRDLKRNYKLLAGVAVFILFMRFVDLYWLVAPDYRAGAFGVSWMDFAAPASNWRHLVGLVPHPISASVH